MDGKLPISFSFPQPFLFDSLISKSEVVNNYGALLLRSCEDAFMKVLL
jgi:hypothetical protein